MRPCSRLYYICRARRLLYIERCPPGTQFDISQNVCSPRNAVIYDAISCLADDSVDGSTTPTMALLKSLYRPNHRNPRQIKFESLQEAYGERPVDSRQIKFESLQEAYRARPLDSRQIKFESLIAPSSYAGKKQSFGFRDLEPQGPLKQAMLYSTEAIDEPSPLYEIPSGTTVGKKFQARQIKFDSIGGYPEYSFSPQKDYDSIGGTQIEGGVLFPDGEFW